MKVVAPPVSQGAFINALVRRLAGCWLDEEIKCEMDRLRDRLIEPAQRTT